MGEMETSSLYLLTLEDPTLKEHEVKELIPKYAFGQLGEPHFSIVEQGLRDHPGLWDEVRFWRAFAWATNLRQLPEGDSHPPPGCLVDYAYGVYPRDSQLLESFEHHLNGCPDCQQRLAEVRVPYDDSPELHRIPQAGDCNRDSYGEGSASTDSRRPPSNFPIDLQWTILALTSALIGILFLLAEFRCSQK